MTEYMPHEQMIHTSPDYFSEALRILDNDMRIIPQREHLTALWGLVVGLSRRLTEARVQCPHHRSAVQDSNHRKPRQEKASRRRDM